MKNLLLLSLLYLTSLPLQVTAADGLTNRQTPSGQRNPGKCKGKGRKTSPGNNNNNNTTTINNPVDQACPEIHIFAARETTAPPGFGTAKVLVDLVLNAFPRATAEEIDYPAAGGDEYGASVGEGIKAVVNQTGAFAARCPGTVIIMHGYSQGAQIMDDAFCGGPDLPSLNSTAPLISKATTSNTMAIILMGNPRHVDGLPFNIGNATAGGFAARPPDFRCPLFEQRIQAYCDSPDPFCSNGTDADTHQGYGDEYGDDALRFILGRLSGRLRVAD